MSDSPLPSASENAAVQEALSIKYVDKIGVAWLPEAGQFALFSNSGKLVAITPTIDNQVIRDLCASQDREWRARLDARLEEQRPGAPATSKSLGDLDL